MGEFGFAQEVTHENTKCSMRRNGSEQSHNAGGEAKLKHVKDVFDSGKTHTDNHCINNSIERFVEIFIVEKYKSHKNELTELFDKRYFEEGVKKLVDNIILFGENQKIYGIAYG
jgi:hypothetical protein